MGATRPRDAHRRTIWGALTLASVGYVLLFLGDRTIGPALALAANLYLGARAVTASQRGARPLGRAAALPYVIAGALLFSWGTLLLDVLGGPDDRLAGMAFGATGAQLILAALAIPAAGSGARRLLVPTLGHLLVILGSSLVLLRPDVTVELAYASGISLLLLHVHWTYQADPARRETMVGWERYVLAVVGLAALLFALNPLVRLNALPGSGGRTTELVARAALTFAIAIFAEPPRPPGWVASQAGGVRQFLSQSVGGLLLMNAILLTLFLALPPTIPVVHAVLTVWLAVAVAFEYGAAIHHFLTVRRRRREAARHEEAPPIPDAPLTVVIAAFNERDVLAAAMARNLALPLPLRFVIAPAARSKDGTVELAQALAREHPTRVACVVGHTGSKAGDLTAAWNEVRTEIALILDADETIDAASIRRAMRILAERPDVSILQGRKTPRAPEASRVAAFAASERRYSTLLDHTMQSDRFGAAHFAGSGAFLRRDVPLRVGGWTSESLTEDIEFTMRLHLAGAATILYDPDVVILEGNPRTFRDLVRQRARWARGWGQVYRLHFVDLLRSRALPTRRKVGLTWQLLTSVSAPWSIFLPALAVLWGLGLAPGTPLPLAVALLAYILPSRGLVWAYVGLVDPAPTRSRLLRTLGTAVHGYAWVLMGWLLQLHAFFLEASAAPRTWYATVKRVEVAEPTPKATIER